jgi:hypothetical protein
MSWPVGSRLDSQKYTSKVNSCQDARQELTECLLKSLCEQTLQPIYYWREYLPKDELPQPLGLNLLRVPQNHQQITWLSNQTKVVLIQVWTCLRGADQQRSMLDFFLRLLMFIHWIIFSWTGFYVPNSNISLAESMDMDVDVNTDVKNTLVRLTLVRMQGKNWQNVC